MKKGNIRPYDWVNGCCLFEGTEHCTCPSSVTLYTPTHHDSMTKEQTLILWEWLADPNTRINI